jgi:hypothetical protein
MPIITLLPRAAKYMALLGINPATWPMMDNPMRPERYASKRLKRFND